MKKIIVLAGLVSVVILACSKNQSDGNNGGGGSIDCSTAAKSFSANVQPIFQSSCSQNSGCHGSGSNNGPGELISYQQIFNARTSIRSAVFSGSMPRGSSLSSAQRNSIICWIDNGAPND